MEIWELKVFFLTSGFVVSARRQTDVFVLRLENLITTTDGYPSLSDAGCTDDAFKQQRRPSGSWSLVAAEGEENSELSSLSRLSAAKGFALGNAKAAASHRLHSRPFNSSCRAFSRFE
ncbi:hypothetical protein Q8A73_023241 [Channa argus]|nr:hypothetical protein Q8A73_023241 [Channa argus]